MKYRYNYTHQFKKDVRLCQRKGLPMQELKDAISILLEQGALPPEYKAHRLSGNMNGLGLSYQAELVFGLGTKRR